MYDERIGYCCYNYLLHYLFIYLFIYSFIHSFVHSFICPFILRSYLTISALGTECGMMIEKESKRKWMKIVVAKFKQ